MIHKPIVGPDKSEWEEPDRFHQECPHGLPYKIVCPACQEHWKILALWGELLDEA